VHDAEGTRMKKLADIPIDADTSACKDQTARNTD
jgi:hypothetical protein